TTGTVYTTTRTYDAANRLSSTSRPIPTALSGGSGTQTIGEAYQGRKVSTTDSLNGVTQRISDVTGHLRQVIDPLPGGTTRYDYDPFGNLVTTTDAIGAIARYTYDVRGYRTGATDADMGAWVTQFDSLGELRTQTNGKNQLATMTYDALSRPL